MVRHSAKLFFIEEELSEGATYTPNPKYPVFVDTDASDYGVGYMIFQVVDSKTRILRLGGRSFTKQELNWDPADKEAYAIIFAVEDNDYLLRDRFFTIRTDHKNLTFINTKGTAKIDRWNIRLQQYYFDIEHIQGKSNTIPDTISRFRPTTEEPAHEEFLLAHSDNFQLTESEHSIISLIHNSTVGHGGLEISLERLTRYLNSKGISMNHTRRKVQRFIRDCPCCQKFSTTLVL